jgi:hypothetical protein
MEPEGSRDEGSSRWWGIDVVGNGDSPSPIVLYYGWQPQKMELGRVSKRWERGDGWELGGCRAGTLCQNL